MKTSMMRLFAVSALLACCVALTGCLSHWFVDSTTRLQVENRTSYTFEGLDIVAEDGSSKTWIDETLAPGERSRVYEEDWVGSFKAKIRWQGEVESAEKTVFDLDLEGGSYYVVLSENEDGSVQLTVR